MLKCAKEAQIIVEREKFEQEIREQEKWKRIKEKAKENTVKFAERLVENLIKRASQFNYDIKADERFTTPNKYGVSYELKWTGTIYANRTHALEVDNTKPIDVELLINLLTTACYDVKYSETGRSYYYNSVGTFKCAGITISFPDSLPCD